MESLIGIFACLLVLTPIVGGMLFVIGFPLMSLALGFAFLALAWLPFARPELETMIYTWPQVLHLKTHYRLGKTAVRHSRAS